MSTNRPDFAEPIVQLPLRPLPRLPEPEPVVEAEIALTEAATESSRSVWLAQLLAFDFEQLQPGELQTARLRMGLIFVGLGAISLIGLLLYRQVTFSSRWTETIQLYWGAYISFVSLGVTGLLIWGREALRLRLLAQVAESDPTEPESLKNREESASFPTASE